MLREPTVSGQFYPSDRADLSNLIDQLTPKVSTKVSAKGIVLPHAGYQYSGGVAVATVSCIQPRQRLILLGPSHYQSRANFSLWGKGQWKIPFAEIDIDEELNDKILASGDLIVEDELAHEQEHSLEVQLPILHHFFGQFKFVPLVCQQTSLENYQQVAWQISEGVKSVKDQVLFVASTDLTHYEPDSTARAKDRAVIEAIVNLDEEALLAAVKKKNITMCGVAPVAIFLHCLKKIGAKKSQVCLYQTSGDSSGNYSSVVGYVGMIVK